MLDRDQDTLVILSRQIDVVMHHHHAVQLVVSLDIPYTATLDHQEIKSIRGFLIDSDIPHACQAAGSTVLVISVDATSAKGRALKQKVSLRRFMLLEELFSMEAIDAFAAAYWDAGREVKHEFNPLALLHQLLDTQAPVLALDARSLAVIEFINQHISKTIKIPAIAQHIGLSESRVRHLFAEQVGIPLTSYILWVRMKVALRGMLQPSMSLADAAHQAGFADHAHFTRTFKRMFGVSPSLLLKYGEFLQVFGL